MRSELYLCLCLLAFVGIAHLLAGRIPNWLFVFLPSVFLVPSIKPMEIDWDKVPDWISAISTAGGIFFAIYAYRGWKKQLAETKRFEVSFDLLREFYKVAWAFGQVVMGPDKETNGAYDRLREAVISLNSEVEVFGDLLGTEIAGNLTTLADDCVEFTSTVDDESAHRLQRDIVAKSLSKAGKSLRAIIKF